MEAWEWRDENLPEAMNVEYESVRGSGSDYSRGVHRAGKKPPIDLAGSSIEEREQTLLTHSGQAIYNPGVRPCLSFPLPPFSSFIQRFLLYNVCVINQTASTHTFLFTVLPSVGEAQGHTLGDFPS